jgi:1,4-alpha-glucan branching enzyme
VDLVWAPDGYPSQAAYRDSHRRTARDHRPWANDGAVYDPDRAREQARADAIDFVARVAERVGAGGLCVCALDTELLGHWWHEGVAWLDAVIDEAGAQGLRLSRLDDAVSRHEPAGLDASLPVTTWGTPRDLSTWDCPAVADLAWRARAAELDLVRTGAGARAARELLALQASDWAFMVSRDRAADYGRRRAQGHARELEAAMATVGSDAPGPRNLAPDLALSALNR